MPRDPAAHQRVHLASLLWLLERAKDWLLAHLDDLAAQSTSLRRAMIELDLGLTLVIGCLRDGVPTNGYEAIDGEDARAWFARHGAAPRSVDSTPIRALYDLYLAYEGGDQGRPAIAAGVAIHAVLRLALGYKGAVVNEMRAGMGEVVIAPIYEALAAPRRQVRVLPPGRAARAECRAVAGRADPHRPPGRAEGWDDDRLSAAPAGRWPAVLAERATRRPDQGRRSPRRRRPRVALERLAGRRPAGPRGRPRLRRGRPRDLARRAPRHLRRLPAG